METKQKTINDSHITITELQNLLLNIISAVTNSQVEYTITDQNQPIAILRPYTDEDALAAWENAFDKELAETLEAAQRIADATINNEMAGINILEKMREESSRRGADMPLEGLPLEDFRYENL